MTRIALLSPTTLLGGEIRDALDRIDGLAADIVLLATDDDAVGTVTQIGSSAALVSKAEPDALAGVDLVIACGRAADDLPLIETRPAGATAIVASPDASADQGIPVVGDINPEAIEPGEVLISPHPVAIALAHLLAPLERFAPQSATATAILPVSHLGAPGLDGLLDQTRAILAMAGERPEGIFGRQLAFNLYPVPDGAGVTGTDRVIPELVARTTGITMPLALRVLQGSIFHGVSVSLFVELGEPPGTAAVREALAEQRAVSVVGGDRDDDGGMVLDDPDDDDAVGTLGGAPGPVEAALRASEVIVGALDEVTEVVGGPTTLSGGRVYSLWAVMDNLNRGGAENVADIAARLLGGRSNLVS